MQVAGIGTDIIDCLRIAKMIELHGEDFLRRVYTQREIEYCSSRKFKNEHYSARWAGKKAVMLAIAATKPAEELWCDIEIRPQQSGHTPVALCGEARQLCLASGIDRVIVSIAHCRHYATGYALAIAGNEIEPRSSFPSPAAEWPTDDWDGDWDDDIPF